MAEVRKNMPRTVAEGFADFLSSLTPSSAESAASASHRSSIDACLRNNFVVNRLFRTGSFGNGTSISGYSDVDYFVSLGADYLSDTSTYTLINVRDALSARFPNTGVRVNCPAVKVPFGTRVSETTEVVPADFIEKVTRKQYRVYDIPDCDGGWMRSSPDAHNDYVSYINEKLSGRVKPLVRFIKAWKYFCQVPISSFYLELRVAKYATDETTISYPEDIQRVLNILYNNDLANMQDPMGISGYIEPCKTDTMFDDAQSKLMTASIRADRALAAYKKGAFKEAFELWDLLYNGRFPSYYR
jgi:hypothetical protein